MTSSHVELARTPDWQSAKAIAFDIAGTRIFIPKNQTVEHENVLYVSRWIVGKKEEELVGTNLDSLLGNREFNKVSASRPQPLTFDASSIIEFFDHASESIGYPKVRFPEGVHLVRAGEQSKAPGTINVTDGGPFGENTWYGRIDREGRFIPSRDCVGWVEQVVERFADNPIAEAVRAGKHSGCCVFCNSGLKTEGSVAHGYGPVCAKNWNLPWSKTA